MNLRYIQYARKSSEKKERQALSIQDQNLECQRYADYHNNNVIQKLEESKTSFKPNVRPVFSNMLKQIKLGEADAILTWKVDRLCRNPSEGGLLLQLLQDGVLKEIRTAVGDVFTSDSDHLLLHLHFGMSNQYSRNLSKDVKRAQLHKCERGEYPKPSPIGFDSVGEKGRENLIHNKFEAPLILKLFEMAARGSYSLGYLAEWAGQQELVSKRTRTKMYKQQIKWILTNPLYHGLFRWLDQYYEGTYKPIITRALFDKVQAALQARTKLKINKFGYWLNGLPKCYECGCSITTTIKKKFYPLTNRRVAYQYHHCTKRRGKCFQSPITGVDFNRQLIKLFSNIRIDKEEWELGLQIFNAKWQAEAKKNEQQTKNHHIKHEVVEAQIRTLVEMRQNGELTPEEFIKYKNEKLEQKARIKALENDQEVSSTNWLELAENFLNTAYYAQETLENGTDEEKVTLVKNICQNLLLKDKKLEIRYKEPYQLLLKPRDSMKWRAW